MSLSKVKSKKSAIGSASSKKISPKASTSAPAAPTALQQISFLEKKLTASSSKNADLNPILDLLELANKNSKLKVRITALNALHNVFSVLIQQGKVIGKVRQDGDQAGDAQATALLAVREWVKGRWNDYQELLCTLLSSQEPSLALASLAILMSLLKTSSRHLSELQRPATYTFDAAFWRRIMQGILLSPHAPLADLQAEFVNKYLNAYDDIRYHFLKVIAELSQLAAARTETFRSTALFMLESLTTMPTSEEDLNGFWAGEPPMKSARGGKSSQNGKKRKRPGKDVGDIDTSTGIFDDSDDDDSDNGLSSSAAAALAAAKASGQHELRNLQMHRKAFSSAWRSFLGTGLVEEDVKRVLVMLHRQVLPHLVEPGMLVDFLADCTDYGGTVALLALNGLFTLITRHGLEYPNFFTKLYNLLDEEALHVRYRPRFMRMLDIFLASPLLPVAMVAAFVKRLARLCLQAPPAAIISVIPFTYNQMKRHPALMTMIHSAEVVEADAIYEDPYQAEESDPLKSGAAESSLWELSSMRKHYHPSVATLAKIFEEAFTKPNYSMEDFYDHTYTTLFQTETTRPLKKAPALAAKPGDKDWDFLFPTKARFDESAQAEEAQLQLETKGDIVSQMWRFA